MPLDRALSLLFRHFSTCFLLVASLTLPLHVAVSYSHRDVIAVAEIHDDIEDFPADRRVGGVGPAELSAYRSSGPIVLLVELAALPVLVAAARRIVERDRTGHLPLVGDAWVHGVFGWRHLRPRRPGPALAGAALAVVVVLLSRALGLLITEAVPEAVAWAGRAVTEGGARALGVPFLLIPAAVAFEDAKGSPGGAPTQ